MHSKAPEKCHQPLPLATRSTCITGGDAGVPEATWRDHQAEAAVDRLHYIVWLVAKDWDAHNWHAVETRLHGRHGAGLIQLRNLLKPD